MEVVMCNAFEAETVVCLVDWGLRIFLSIHCSDMKGNLTHICHLATLAEMPYVQLEVSFRFAALYFNAALPHRCIIGIATQTAEECILHSS